MAFPSLRNFNKRAEEQPLLSLLVYSFLGFLRPVIHVFLTPLYLSVLPESEYAIYDLMFITGNLLMIILTLRLNAAMLTVYYDYLDDRTKIKTFLSSLFTTSILIGIGFWALFYFIGPLVFDWMYKADEIQFYPYGILVVSFAILGEINACYFIYLRNEKDLVRYFIVIASQVLSSIILQVLFMVVLDMGVFGALLGYLISNIGVFIMILIMERGIITSQIDTTMIKKSFRFSLALIPFLLIYWVLTKGGKLFLERYADLTAVAVFALLITLGSLIILLVEAVINGIRPFLFEIFAKDKKSASSSKVNILTRMIVNLPLLGIPAIVLVGNNINYVTSKAAYMDVAIYSSAVALVTYLLVYTKLFYQQLIFAKRSETITVLSFLVMIVLVFGLYSLVPTYKIWGVLVATLVANALMAILFYWAAQRHLSIDYKAREIFLAPFITFGMLFLLEYLIVYQWQVGRPLFSLIQFVVLVSLIILLNLKSIGQYKAMFVNR